jgi:hypothetical protein
MSGALSLSWVIALSSTTAERLTTTNTTKNLFTAYLLKVASLLSWRFGWARDLILSLNIEEFQIEIIVVAETQQIVFHASLSDAA